MWLEGLQAALCRVQCHVSAGHAGGKCRELLVSCKRQTTPARQPLPVAAPDLQGVLSNNANKLVMRCCGVAGGDVPEEGHSLVAALLAAVLALAALAAVLHPLQHLLAICRRRFPGAHRERWNRFLCSSSHFPKKTALQSSALKAHAREVPCQNCAGLALAELCCALLHAWPLHAPASSRRLWHARSDAQARRARRAGPWRAARCRQRRCRRWPLSR